MGSNIHNISSLVLSERRAQELTLSSHFPSWPAIRECFASVHYVIHITRKTRLYIYRATEINLSEVSSLSSKTFFHNSNLSIQTSEGEERSILFKKLT